MWPLEGLSKFWDELTNPSGYIEQIFYWVLKEDLGYIETIHGKEPWKNWRLAKRNCLLTRGQTGSDVHLVSYVMTQAGWISLNEQIAWIAYVDLDVRSLRLLRAWGCMWVAKDLWSMRVNHETSNLVGYSLFYVYVKVNYSNYPS